MVISTSRPIGNNYPQNTLVALLTFVLAKVLESLPNRYNAL